MKGKKMQDILKRKESYNHSPTVFSGKGIHVEKTIASALQPNH